MIEVAADSIDSNLAGHSNAEKETKSNATAFCLSLALSSPSPSGLCCCRAVVRILEAATSSR